MYVDSLILEDFCEWIQLYMTVIRVVCRFVIWDVMMCLYIYLVTFWKTMVPLFKKTASGDEAVCPFRTSVTIYQSSWSNIPDDLDRQQHHYQNVKSYSVWFVRFLNSSSTSSVWHHFISVFLHCSCFICCFTQWQYLWNNRNVLNFFVLAYCALISYVSNFHSLVSVQLSNFMFVCTVLSWLSLITKLH